MYLTTSLKEMKMTVRDRDELLIRVLRLLRWEGDMGKRYGLQQLGESLLCEYRDLNYSIVKKNIDRDYPT